ncbi:MAG: VOC family protein [Bacteroidales bacterium]|nr:VOC family protein [Bacteroidales bacterium]
MRRIIILMILGIPFVSCTSLKTEEKLTEELNQMQHKVDSLLNTIDKNKLNCNSQIVSFLTFQEENAEEAMNFYVSLFDNSKIVDIQRYQEGETEKVGTIKVARFLLNGSPFMCSDSYIKHDWSFTPAVSIFVDIDTEEQIVNAFEKLSEGGKVMMPLDNYGFSKKFAFVEDRFGVSWQLNLK